MESNLLEEENGASTLGALLALLVYHLGEDGKITIPPYALEEGIPADSMLDIDADTEVGSITLTVRGSDESQ